MTAFVTPQPDHRPLHIGQSTTSRNLFTRIKTKQFMFCGFISQGRCFDFESVGSSAIWVSLTSLLLRMETEQTANTNTNQSLNSRVNKRKSLVDCENVVECTSEHPSQGCRGCRGTFLPFLHAAAAFSLLHCLSFFPKSSHHLIG